MQSDPCACVRMKSWKSSCAGISRADHNEISKISNDEEADLDGWEAASFCFSTSHEFLVQRLRIKSCHPQFVLNRLNSYQHPDFTSLIETGVENEQYSNCTGIFTKPAFGCGAENLFKFANGRRLQRCAISGIILELHLPAIRFTRIPA